MVLFPAGLSSWLSLWPMEARNALRDFLSSPMYICLSRAICGAISSIATNIHSSDDKLCHFKLINNHLREQSQKEKEVNKIHLFLGSFTHLN